MENDAVGDLGQMTQEQVKSWKDLKAEICLKVKSESFWLVPEYTGKDRVEISVDDFFKQKDLISHILLAFPGSRIADVVKPTPKESIR